MGIDADEHGWITAFEVMLKITYIPAAAAAQHTGRE
jgi:hypothetical protein